MLLTSLGHKYAGIVEEYLPPIDPPAQSELIKGLYSCLLLTSF
jgi:hypothetical protein